MAFSAAPMVQREWGSRNTQESLHRHLRVSCDAYFYVSTWLVALITGKMLFLGVSARLFLEEISIWTDELSNAGGPPQDRWASSNQLRAWKEQNGRRANWLPLLELSYPPALGHHISASGSLDFRLRSGLMRLANSQALHWDWIRPLASLFSSL